MCAVSSASFSYLLRPRFWKLKIQFRTIEEQLSKYLHGLLKVKRERRSVQDRLNDVRRILVLRESRTRTESNSSAPLHGRNAKGSVIKF